MVRRRMGAFILTSIMILNFIRFSEAAIITTEVEAGYVSLISLDNKTATSGTISSYISNYMYSNGAGYAEATESGALSVWANTLINEGDFTHYYATATWSEDYINENDKACRYTLQIDVSDFTLEVGGGDHNENHAEYSIDAYLNGSSIWNSNNLLTPAVNTSASPIYLPNTMNVNGDFYEVDLGIVNPGTSFNVLLSANVTTGNCDRSGAASVSPIMISSNISTKAVPEPGITLLLSTSLPFLFLGLAMINLRKRKTV